MGGVRRAAQWAWKAGKDRQGFECGMPGESEAALRYGLDGRLVVLVIRHDEGDRHAGVDEEVGLVTSARHPGEP
jgi:hypothetical protein